MPAPIVIRNLTPETKKAANPEPGEPLIATKADLRDGSRVSSAPDPVDPIDPGTIDWAARLAKTGSGTPDSTFDPETDVTYVGAFLIPYFSNGTTSTTLKDYIGYKPPEAGGRNGANGSIFIGGDGAGGGGWVGEVQIPDYSNTSGVTDYTQLPEATVLQDLVRVIDSAPIQDTDPSAPVTTPSAMEFIGDTLYMSFYAYYEAEGGNVSNVLVCQDAKDLANSSYIGFLEHSGGGKDFKYGLDIPTDKQAMFNGATHFMGVWASHSIIGRSSFGPALYGWKPADIQPGATNVAVEEWTMYGSNGGEIEFWSYSGEELVHWYEDQLGIARDTLSSYLAQDPTTRVSDPTTLPLPDVSLYPSSGHNTQIACAFIPPGTDTIMFVGKAEGHRFGSLYKADYWERLDSPGGYHPTSVHDEDNFYWTMNLNDVAGAAAPNDPGLIQQGIFDDSRWKIEVSYRVRGMISSGTFDPDARLLYLCHTGLSTNQKVISVYQVGGGV